MKRVICKFTVLLLVAVLSLSAFAMQAMAAGDDLTVDLSVSITASGTLPKKDEDYVIRLTADDAGFPMPEGQVGGIYELTVTGPNADVFPTISFDRVGIYTYQVEMIAGTYPDAKYDETIYTMVATVTNGEEDGDLELTVAFHKTDSEEKPDGVAFHVRYKIIPLPEPPDTPKTGVNDYWMLYLAGSLALLAASAYVIVLLVRRKES